MVTRFALTMLFRVFIFSLCHHSFSMAFPDINDIDINSFLKRGQGEIRSSGTEPIPPKAIEILRKHSVWRTSTLMRTDVFGQNLLMPWISKKWKVMPSVRKDSVALVELTKLSILPKETNYDKCRSASLSQTERDRMCGWGPGYVDLSWSIEFFDFDNFTFSTENIEWRFFKSGGFAMINKTIYVVFSPSQPEEIGSPGLKNNVHVWKAPLGMVSDLLNVGLFPVPQPTPPSTTYLRYDLRGVRNVVLDESFPMDHIESLKNACQKWNSSLGKEFFLLDRNPKRLDPLECIASQDLCLFWSGNKDIAWNGVGGLATPSFDAESGMVQGGNIFVVNTVAGDPTPTPPDYLAVIQMNQIPFAFAANIVMKREEFSRYLHPWPALFMEALFLHEIGHDAGHPHYFAGSNKGGQLDWDEFTGEKGMVRVPSDTVMDYIPFPAFHLNNNLGPRDVQKIKAVYENLPLLDEMGCSDFQAGMASCHPQDLGEPIVWYFSLAQFAKEGIFSDEPVSGGFSWFKRGRIIDRLIAYLLTGSTASLWEYRTVTDFFCHHPEKERIVEVLRVDYPNHNIALDCQ